MVAEMRHSAGVSDFRQITAVDCHIPTSEVSNPDQVSLCDDTSSSVSKELPSSCVLLTCQSCGAPLSELLVRVNYDPNRFGRRTNRSHEAAIHSRWRRLLRQNPRLYNGSKFRVAAVSRDPSPTSDQCCRPVCLSLGLTCYRDHMGTNCCQAAARLLQEAGSTVHGNPQAFMADCVGVGALLLTADNRFVFMRRAGWTGEYPCRLDRPGGHAEPDYLLKQISTPSVAECGGGVRDDSWLDMLHREHMPNELVCHEIFDSVRREVTDELGISETHLSRPLLIALTRDSNYAGRPTLEFIIRCSLPSTEVLRVYGEGNQSEADESVGLVFLHIDQVMCSRSVQQLTQSNPIAISGLDDAGINGSSLANGHGQSEIEYAAEEDASDHANGDELGSGSEFDRHLGNGQSDRCPTEDSMNGSKQLATATSQSSIDTSTTATSSPCSVLDALARSATDRGATLNGRCAGGAPSACRDTAGEECEGVDDCVSPVGQKPALAEVWGDMTPACKASICLLQRLRLSQLSFKF